MKIKTAKQQVAAKKAAKQVKADRKVKAVMKKVANCGRFDTARLKYYTNRKEA